MDHLEAPNDSIWHLWSLMAPSGLHMVLYGSDMVPYGPLLAPFGFEFPLVGPILASYIDKMGSYSNMGYLHSL